MAGFTKLFSEIVTSSIWSEDDKTRIVWITMLALVADKHGFVPASLPGLANAARVSLKDCQQAIDKFKSPDPYSRTKEFEGRRIDEVDGGWLILNYEKKRNQSQEDDRREYMAEYMRKKRSLLTGVNNQLTTANPSASVLSESEEGESEGKQPLIGFLTFWETWPKHKRKSNRKACLRLWVSEGLEKHYAVILTGLNLWMQSKDWKKEDGQYIPAPLVWLRQHRWEAADALKPEIATRRPPERRIDLPPRPQA